MSSESWLGKFATPIIDLLTIFTYSFLIHKLVNLFVRQDIWIIPIILVAYYLMCAAILVSKRLEQNPDLAGPAKKNRQDWLTGSRAEKGKDNGSKKPDIQPGCIMALSWPFAIFVVVTIFRASGILESGNEMGARLERFITEEAIGTILALVVFFSTMLLFPLALIKKPRPRIKYGTGTHFVMRTLSVVAVNCMVLVTTAFWEWQLAGTEPLDISLAAKILVFVLAYAVFLMFYAPPRLALLSLEPSRWSYTGYIIFLGYTLWNYMK